MIETPDRAVALVQKYELLREMVVLEPRLLHWFQIAAKQEDPDERWNAYTALKHECSQLVGFDAKNPALATTWHYEAMIEALDTLLPRRKKGAQEWISS